MKSRRKPTIEWSTSRVDGFVDFASNDGRWCIEQGRDNYLARHGKPYLLTHLDPKKKRWMRIDGFASVKEATQFAEEMSE